MSKPSLFAENLPAIASQDNLTAMQQTQQAFDPAPFVAFASTKSPAYARILMACPDVQEGDPILLAPEPAPPQKLVPFRFFLLHATQYWAQFDAQYVLQRVTFDVQVAKGDRSLDDVIEAALLAYSPDGLLVPATCRFRTTKTGAAKAALAAYHDAQKPTWADRGADYRASMGAPDPRFRFTTTVILKPMTSRSSGYKYVAALGRVMPTGISDLTALKSLFEDTDRISVVDQVMDRYNARVQEAKSKS